MTQYIIRRVLISIPLLFLLSLTSFIVFQLAPGDPIQALIDPEEMLYMGPHEIDELLAEYGLDKPVPVQYFLWLKEAIQGNLGYSIQTHNVPVLELILDRLPPTISLMTATVAVGLALGLLFGVISALYQYSRMDYTLTISAFFMLSVPEFFFALMGMFIFAVTLGWFPTFGMWTPGGETGINWDLLHHAVLPVFALAMNDIAGLMRYARASVLDTISADFVTTARAKGLSERLILWKHVFRNALIPIVTLIGLRLPVLFGGALIVETIFRWPGVGLLGYTALLQRDYPVIMGVLIISSVITLAANLLTDIAYAWVDPRVRHS